jgi:hypothetical protein
MSNTHFAWPYGGVDLGTWLRSWERRVAGRPADRWTYSITREERYQQQGETRELSGPDDAVRALQAHATHAAEVSVHPGIPGRLSVLGGSRQLPWEVVGFGVAAHWDDGMHMRAVVTSPGELAGWLAGLGRALLEEDLPHPRVPSGAIAPVEVTLTAVGRLRFTIRVTDRYGVLTCTGQTAEFAKQTLHLPALAGLAHRPVATLRELADWLGEVAGRLTGTAVVFTVPHDAPLPPGTLAKLKVMYLGGV